MLPCLVQFGHKAHSGIREILCFKKLKAAGQKLLLKSADTDGKQSVTASGHPGEHDLNDLWFLYQEKNRIMYHIYSSSTSDL